MSVKINDLMKKYEIVDATFDDLSKLNFAGVYIIYDPSDENKVVYIGSAYARTIKERLSQYTKTNDTGNTLMHAICNKDYNVEKVKDILSEYKKKAVEKIKKFGIKAIRHNDLEYQLIDEAKPKYNTVGIDTTGKVVDDTDNS